MKPVSVDDSLIVSTSLQGMGRHATLYLPARVSSRSWPQPRSHHEPMANLSDWAESALLALLLGITDLTMPADTFMQLHTGAPGEAGTSNVATTSTRQEITTWAAASGGAIASSAAVSFTGAATETISHFSLWSASSGGNCLAVGTLTVNRPITSGDILTFASGDVDLVFALTCLTVYAANALLEHLVGRTDFAMPTNTYAKLHIGVPGTSAANNAAAETDRVLIDWGSVSGGAVSNDAAITWTAVAASETVSHFSVWDASTSGNPLLHGALASSKALTSGGNAEFAVGELDVAIA
jgi:hypothetical protein